MLVCFVGAERSGATTKVLGKMGWCLYNQHLCGGLGVCGWFWVWWVGQYDQFCTPDWHFWALHQVLPVPTIITTATPSQHHQRLRLSTASSPPSPPPLNSFGSHGQYTTFGVEFSAVSRYILKNLSSTPYTPFISLCLFWEVVFR